MKRRAAALVFCLLLVFQLAAPPVKAAGTVYFVAVGNEVQPLSEQTMPFWSGGNLYIPASIFTGNVWKMFGVRYNYNEAKQVVTLYNNSGDHSLIFYLDRTYTLDREGNVSYPGALVRSGVPFVPASMVAKYFNLDYSIMEVSHGYLVWLRLPGFGLTDKEFANAAIYPMEVVYGDYLQAMEQAQTSSEAPGSTHDPGTASGKSVYLCLKADADTSALLDTLDRYDAQAAFFCTPEFLRENGDLLRRMTATGQAVGILADAADPERSVEEQLEEGNRALALATCGKTRLAYVENGDDGAVRTAEAAGFCCLKPDLDRSKYDLQSTSNASTLLQRVSARRGDVTVWLADTANAVGLRAFLSAAGGAEDRCLAVTETA